MAAIAPRLLVHLRRLADPAFPDQIGDAGQLERFLSARDEAAFEALVRRHGPMVLRVCRRLLGDVHAAEDAFQATFLVLARKAASIKPRAALAGWLYGVARRVALKAQADDARRRRHEVPEAFLSPADPRADPLTQLSARELLAALEKEIQGLREVYRVPVVLCCLEGLSQEEAAHRLGWTPGSVKGRLERGRKLLHARLAKRGLTLSAALAVGEVSRGAAGVPAALAATTLRAALADTASSGVATLAGSALRGTGFGRFPIVPALLLAVGVAAVGAGLLPQTPSGGGDPSGQKQLPKNPAPISGREQAGAGKDLYGDPLPPRARSRLGTLRQRAPDADLAVTADGREVVTVGPSLTVRRFDALTGKLRTTRQLPAGRPYHTWLSPRGTFALTSHFRAPGGYELDLWELAKGERRGNLRLGFFNPTGAGFSADGRRVAFAGSERDTHRVLVWDVGSDKPREMWSQTEDIQRQFFEPFAALSPDGKRLLACHLDQTLRCWEVEGGKLLWEAEGKNYSPLVFFSHDGRAVVRASGSDVRDAATGKLLAGRRPPPKEAVYPIGFSPDGRFLAFQTGREELVLWEPGAAQAAYRFAGPAHRQDAGHVVPNHLPADFAFTPDGKALIRRAGALQRWDLTTGKPVYADTEGWGHTGAVTRMLFSPDGRLLASAATDQTVRLWDVKAGRSVHAFPRTLSDHLAFTPDGRRVLVVPPGLGKTVLRQWDVATGRAGRGFELADRKESGTTNRDRELRVTADGKKILILTWKNGRAGAESVLTTWDAATGACLVHKRVPWAEDSLLTPDGEGVLALDIRSGEVALVAVATEAVRIRFESDRVRNPKQSPDGCDFALSPDGRLLAWRVRSYEQNVGMSEDEHIRIGEMATGRQVHKVPAAGPAVFAFSADSRLLGVAADGIRLWEMASGKQVGVIPIPGGRPCAAALAFSPDGRTAATGHADSTILLWDVPLRAGARGRALAGAEGNALWADLAGADAARAYAAIGRLADDPGRAVPLIKERLRPVPPAAAEVRELLEGLDSNQFKVRDAAERKLREYGERAGAVLRRALADDRPLEARRRIEAVLAALAQPGPLAGEPLGALRAVQVLEWIGSAEARGVLEGLSRGAESARLTRAAKESLSRLKAR